MIGKASNFFYKWVLLEKNCRKIAQFFVLLRYFNETNFQNICVQQNSFLSWP